MKGVKGKQILPSACFFGDQGENEVKPRAPNGLRGFPDFIGNRAQKRKILESVLREI